MFVSVCVIQFCWNSISTFDVLCCIGCICAQDVSSAYPGVLSLLINVKQGLFDKVVSRKDLAGGGRCWMHRAYQMSSAFV